MSLKNLVKKFDQSLDNLKLSQIYGILLHQPIKSLSSNKKIYLDFLNYLKTKNIVKKIGYSVYSPKELELLWEIFIPDIIQIPCNIFDNRFAIRLTINNTFSFNSAFLSISYIYSSYFK